MSQKTPKKLFIRTFGCQMNEYDSGKMVDVLNASEPMEVTHTPEDAGNERNDFKMIEKTDLSIYLNVVLSAAAENLKTWIPSFKKSVAPKKEE